MKRTFFNYYLITLESQSQLHFMFRIICMRDETFHRVAKACFITYQSILLTYPIRINEIRLQCVLDIETGVV